MRGSAGQEQALIQSEGRAIDMITCSEGSTVCFDITDAYNTL